MEVNGSSKNSSLLRYGNNYGRKKFQSTALAVYLFNCEIKKIFEAKKVLIFQRQKKKKKHLSVFATAPRICPVRNNPECNNPKRNKPAHNNPEHA